MFEDFQPGAQHPNPLVGYNMWEHTLDIIDSLLSNFVNLFSQTINYTNPNYYVVSHPTPANRSIFRHTHPDARSTQKDFPRL